jgi:Fe-S cluster assembly ATP-binding protein
MMLEIKNLEAEMGENKILKGLNLEVNEKEMHVIMGPNGSGKTTLTKAIMGHPSLKVTGGDILIDKKSIKGLPPDERARLGLFLQFQNPIEIEGAGFITFIRTAKDARNGGLTDVKGLISRIKEYSKELGIEDKILERGINQGFSGGEKKKSEILQMALLEPKISILDEPDSGLDIDSLKIVAGFINRRFEETEGGFIIITHYNRMLAYIKPKFVHIMMDGKIVASGGPELIERVERDGYDSFKV